MALLAIGDSPIARRLFALAIGGAAGVLCVALFYLALLFDELGEKEVDFQTSVDRIERIAREIDRATEELLAIDAPACSNDFVVAMRAIEFASTFLRDIGHLRDDLLVCTSTVGALDVGVPHSPPTLVTPRGFEIWLQELLIVSGRQVPAIIVKPPVTPQFNFVLSAAVSEFSILEQEYAAVYLRGADSRFVLLGGDYRVPEPVPFTGIHIGYRTGGMQVSGCNRYSTTFCPSLFVPWLQPLTDSGALVLVLLSGLIACAATASAVSRVLYKRTRFRRRFWRGFRVDRFVNHYQPVYGQDGRIMGCEVLVRWRDENDLIRAPDRFLRHVSSRRETRRLLEFVVSNATQDLTAAVLPERFKIAFNITADDIDFDFLVATMAPLRRHFPNAVVCLEIVEDALVDTQDLAKVSARLKAEGYQLSIDDFGTGYSSLNYLSELHFDELKVDRSFVRNLNSGSVKSQLVLSILSMARALNMRCVIEGVETEEQATWLWAAGANAMQGYLFSRPVPIAALIGLLSETGVNELASTPVSAALKESAT